MKNKTKTPATIRITTLDDLVNAATPQNRELLIQDLNLWLSAMLTIKTLGIPIDKSVMDWTDDGKNEITGIDIKIRKKSK